MDSYEQAFQNGIDLYALPRKGKKQIDFINSACCPVKIYKEYKNGKIIDLTVVIERYDEKTQKVYFVGYEKGIFTGNLTRGKIGTIFTSIAINHPDKVPFFVNTEDAYKYTSQSCKKVLLICPICGRTYEMRIDNFINNGFTCPNKNCQNSYNYKHNEAMEGVMKGENHPNWQGGITPIKNHLRTVINPFMETHKEFLNYTCELSNKNGTMNSHHIYPFINIVHDAHNKNNITIKPNVCDYSTEELKALEDYVLSWHVIGDWSNMILLAEDVHKQLHKQLNEEYGKGYNPTLTVEAAHKFMEKFKITWSSVAA